MPMVRTLGWWSGLVVVVVGGVSVLGGWIVPVSSLGVALAWEAFWARSFYLRVSVVEGARGLVAGCLGAADC